MDERAYEGLVVRYSAPGARRAAWRCRAFRRAGAWPRCRRDCRPASRPHADFPSAASTPPVNIMTPEPGAPGSAAPPRRPTPAATAPLPASRPAATRQPPRRRRRQKTARAEVCTRADADHAEFSTAGTGRRRRQRLMLRPCPLTSGACPFISSSLPSAAIPSGNSSSGLPNGWRRPRRRACRSGISTSRG